MKTDIAILLTIFITCVISCQILATKLCVFNLYFFKIVIPAGVLPYCITYLITDIVGDVYGKRIANKFVLLGLIANIAYLLLAVQALYLPIAHVYSNTKLFEHYFNMIVIQNINIIIASIIAYCISQTHDVYSFHFWKKFTKGRHLWLRNNASTLVSQFIDSCIFMTLAFYIIPLLTLGHSYANLSTVWNMILSEYSIKAIIALCDTPFCYLGVKILQKTSRRWFT